MSSIINVRYRMVLYLTKRYKKVPDDQGVVTIIIHHFVVTGAVSVSARVLQKQITRQTCTNSRKKYLT